MQTDVQRKEEQKPETSPLSTWTKRLVISLTILVWIVLTGAFFWLLGRVAQAALLLAIGALLAYTIYPFVKLLQRLLPRQRRLPLSTCSCWACSACWSTL